MDVITMPSVTLLVDRLAADFPQYAFVAGDTFQWSPTKKTVFFDQNADDKAVLLHELSHAILNHADYKKDIQLIEMERNTWIYAQHYLTPIYDVPITEDMIQDALDTYRDWLHARSTCPYCQATGLQVRENTYHCIVCRQQWRVNDARMCALRRRRMYGKH